MPTRGPRLGTDSWAGFIFPSCLMTNANSLLPGPHSFAFYQEGDNECTAIDFQGISAPRDRESITWIRDTFLPSLINFLLLLWQAPLHISFGSASFPSSGSRREQVGGDRPAEALRWGRHLAGELSSHLTTPPPPQMPGTGRPFSLPKGVCVGGS